MAKGVKTGGRVAGVPNKATQEARQSIAAFVDGNAHRLQEWLDSIAEGIPQIDPETDKPTGKYITDPNPEKAFALFQSVIEYHVPKLARSEIQPLDKDGNKADNVSKIVIEHVTVKK